jgi:hypothetical protein
MSWSEELQAYTYSCPCGDLFQITLVSVSPCTPLSSPAVAPGSRMQHITDASCLPSTKPAAPQTRPPPPKKRRSCAPARTSRAAPAAPSSSPSSTTPRTLRRTGSRPARRRRRRRRRWLSTEKRERPMRDDDGVIYLLNPAGRPNHLITAARPLRRCDCAAAFHLLFHCSVLFLLRVVAVDARRRMLCLPPTQRPPFAISAFCTCC